MYVLVTSYRPLKVWGYKLGFARFSNENYNNDITDIDNLYVHLTNVAIQKYSDKYTSTHGGKLNLDKLRFYFEQSFGLERTMNLFEEINQIFILSLKMVQKVI